MTIVAMQRSLWIYLALYWRH